MPAHAGEYENKIVTTIDAMKTKVKFVKPAILREVSLESEGQILAGSIVDQVEVLSAGQEVHDINAEESEFDWNQDWQWE